MRQHNSNGTFKRTRKEWSLDNFDDGYVDSRGRFRVWSPNNIRSYKGGYILRSIVAYEKYHKASVPIGYEIHHKDRNRINDSLDNLQMLSKEEHAAIHYKERTVEVERFCTKCKKSFLIRKWRLNDKSRGKYCSQSCYNSRGKRQ